MPFTKIDFVLPARVRMMFVPAAAMGGHGLMAPVFVCADPSGQNSMVVDVVNVTVRGEPAQRDRRCSVG